jgi:hypothetical protein
VTVVLAAVSGASSLQVSGKGGGAGRGARMLPVCCAVGCPRRVDVAASRPFSHTRCGLTAGRVTQVARRACPPAHPYIRRCRAAPAPPASARAGPACWAAPAAAWRSRGPPRPWPRWARPPRGPRAACQAAPAARRRAGRRRPRGRPRARHRWSWTGRARRAACRAAAR